jgi:hypothetical protein
VLKEKRRDQREQLQEKGGDQHFGQEMPIFVDRTEKPGEIETPAEIAQSRPSSH